jgi:YesN/AraC family two-component response regulator
MKILIVDDESATRRGIVSSLKWEEFGIDGVFEASDGREALRIAGRNKIDIIISDIRMPNLNGIDLMEALYKKYDCQIILMSAYTEKEYLKSAIRFHAVGYIEKPVNLAELKNVICEASQNSHAVRSGESRLEGLKKQNAVFWAADDHIYPGEESDEGPFIEKTIMALAEGRPAAVERSLAEMVKILRENKRVDARNAKVLFYKVCSVMMSYFRLSGIHETEQEPFDSETINALETVEECSRFLSRLYTRRCAAIARIPESTLLAAKVHLVLEYYYQSSGLYIPFICQMLSVGKSKLCDIYKKEIGKTINESIMQYRLEKACELLKNKNLSILEISSRTGFSDQNYFTRIFKHMFGVTPSAYQAGINS